MIEFVVLAQAVSANVDPTLFWMTALAGTGGAFMWLLKVHLDFQGQRIGYLEKQVEDWKRLAMKGADITEKAVEAKS